MTNPTHTSLPWRIDAVYGVKSDADTELLASTYCEPNPQRNKANAEFIVKACNSHYELLEACKAVLVSIQGADDQLERIVKQAIAKTEGK